MSKLNPPETIFTIALENRVLRWATIFLSAALVICALAIFVVSRRPQIVWAVYENGRIVNSSGLFFEWEPREAARVALKSFLVEGPRRDEYLHEYFDAEFLKLKSTQKPSRAVVDFDVTNVVFNDDGSVVASGVLRRSSTNPSPILISMRKSVRTNLNPFGLMVTDVKKEQDPGKEPEDVLMTVVTSTIATVADHTFGAEPSTGTKK